jgi:TolA-binding protein
MKARILAIGLLLPLCLAACGGGHSASTPTATADPALLDARMKQMQADLEQMRQQQLQMQQQQEQQRQQQLQLLYQQRQAAAAAGTAVPPPVPGAAPAITSPLPSANNEVLPAFHWYDPSEPKQKPDVKGNDQKI